jgi:hypothetical protein
MKLIFARQITSAVRQPAPWTLAYDASDPMARVVAERIALNARDAGLTLQLATSGAADLRLVRVPLASLNARLALADLATEFGLPQPRFGGETSEDMYTAERTLLQSQRVIPLLHLRVNYGLSKAVHNWAVSPDGRWHLPGVWLGGEQP